MNLLEAEIAYIAGIFDGEGSIGYYRTKRGRYKLNISITNTNFLLLSWLQNKVPFGRVRVQKRGYWSRIWELEICKRKDVIQFLSTICPFLVVKKEQVNLLLSHLNTEQEVFAYSCKKLPDHVDLERIKVVEVLKQLKGRASQSVH